MGRKEELYYIFHFGRAHTTKNTGKESQKYACIRTRFAWTGLGGFSHMARRGKALGAFFGMNTACHGGEMRASLGWDEMMEVL